MFLGILCLIKSFESRYKPKFIYIFFRILIHFRIFGDLCRLEKNVLFIYYAKEQEIRLYCGRYTSKTQTKGILNRSLQPA